MTQIAPQNDLVMIYDVSASEYGKATLFDAVSSVISGGDARITVAKDSNTGKVSFSFNQSGLVSGSRQVIAGNGLSGGGMLSSDVTLTVELGSVPTMAAIDSASDRLAFFDESTNATRAATVDEVTQGVTASRPLGSIA